MKSKQIILLHLKGCMLSDFSSELKFKSIGWKCSVFLNETYLWTITEQTPYWLETCLFNVLLFKAACSEVCRFLLGSWLGQGCGECLAVALSVISCFWGWLFQQTAGRNPCPPQRWRCGEQSHKAALCSGCGSASTGFAHVGGCAQVLLSERLVGNKGANKKWMLPWLLVPPARGARAAARAEKHKHIEILAWLCPPQ